MAIISQFLKMHEISLVRNIFRTLESEFSTEEVEKIKTVNLKVGVLSNIEPVLMQSAFEAVTATDSPQYRHVKLAIETVQIQILCESCNEKSSVQNYRFVCSHCDKPTNNIIAGMELLIRDVEFE
jgi:hydrogenase nickel incorporation protein HypA/HybF